MKKFTWHKIAEAENEINFQPNNMATLEVNGRKMGIGKFGHRIFAFVYTCPHAGGMLTEGWIDEKGQVVCPLHRYRFSLENGRNTSGEGYYLKHWPVAIRSDGIFVGMEEGGLFSWL